MLSTAERKAKLEELLTRAEKNRGRLAAVPIEPPKERRAAAIDCLPTPTEPPPAPVFPTAPRMDALPIEPEAEPAREAEPVALTSIRQPAAPIAEASAPEPTFVEQPVATAAVEPEEPRVFEASPKASREVAMFRGTAPKDWSLDAVLDRAFGVGAR